MLIDANEEFYRGAAERIAECVRYADKYKQDGRTVQILRLVTSLCRVIPASRFCAPTIIIIIVPNETCIIENKYNYLKLYCTSIGTRSAFFSMKAAELKCQNLIVKKVCQVEHFKTFRKAIGPELGL